MHYPQHRGSRRNSNLRRSASIVSMLSMCLRPCKTLCHVSLQVMRPKPCWTTMDHVTSAVSWRDKWMWMCSGVSSSCSLCACLLPLVCKSAVWTFLWVASKFSFESLLEIKKNMGGFLFCEAFTGICIHKHTYFEENKYLIYCQFCKFFHLQRMERSLIFIVGTLPTVRKD